MKVQDANRAPHGKMDDFYERILKSFLANVPTQALSEYSTSSVKKSKDKLRAIISSRVTPNT